MSLKLYRQKRNFKKTSEPAGKVKKSSSKKRLYIIQKHAASHLHYDFRLELDGVLKSWAVPKGPCLDPSVKRLAMHVEDHPLEYGNFEGIIPKGQYGGGTVMLWDKGEWVSEDADPLAAYKKGSMTFKLEGKKLKGLWKLIRIRSDPKSWLLFKINDKYAKPLAKFDVTLKKTKSVKSNRTMDQIAEGSHKVWNSSAKKTTSNLTNPDKILYPEDDISKSQIADYYAEVKDWILPYITKRPLSLLRCPDGYQKCFFQKNLQEKNATIFNDKSFVYIKNNQGLQALAQLAVLEIHIWGSPLRNIDKPDMIVFDLDPAEDVPWKKVVDAAFTVKEHLDDFGLKSFVKTTGGKGLHVVIPIKPLYDWDYVKTFAGTLVNFLVMSDPKKYVSKMTKNIRKGKIFLDYFRNIKGATSVSPYSTRARLHAPVSTPLHWDELTNNYKDTFFTVETVLKRLEKLKKDPWKDFFDLKQSLAIK